MFIHNFKYSFKILLKNKMLIFWTFAFPILLGTFFYMAFSNIESSEKIDILNIAIVPTDSFQNRPFFKEYFTMLGDEGEDQLFHIQYVSEEEAVNLLEEEEIVGYFMLTDIPRIVVKKSGISETILKFITEQLLHLEDVMGVMLENSVTNGNIGEQTSFHFVYETMYQEVMSLLQEKNYIVDISSNHLSYTMIEFYTLIAMTCLYGGVLGMVAVNQNLANMSSNGRRVSVSPVFKGKLIVSSVLASYCIQLIGIVLLFVYTMFVLKVDYGDHILLTFFLALVGCLAGLSFGVMIASLVKTGDQAKTGMIVAFTMLGCFLSGMMGITMKYVIDTNIPLLNWLNPASMITDGLYSLYYYDTFDRYGFDLFSLILFSLIMMTLSIGCLRRQKYDCI